MKNKFIAMVLAVFQMLSLISVNAFAATSYGWKISYFGAIENDRDSASAEDAQTYKFDGEKAMYIKYRYAKTKDDYILIKNNITEDMPDGDYTLTFYVKGASSNDTEIYVGDTIIKYGDAVSNTSVSEADTPSGGTNWKKRTYTVSYTEQKNPYLAFKIYGGISQCAIDNVSLINDSTGAEMLYDGGFENVLKIFPEEDKYDTSTYQATKLIVGEGSGKLGLTWRNPENTLLKKVSLYDITDGENKFITSDISTSAGQNCSYIVEDLENDNTYQYRLDFEFASKGVYSFYMTGTPSGTAPSKMIGNWKINYTRNSAAGFVPTSIGIDEKNGYDGGAALKVVSNHSNQLNGNKFLRAARADLYPLYNITELSGKYKMSLRVKPSTYTANAVSSEGYAAGMGLGGSADYALYFGSSSQKDTVGEVKIDELTLMGKKIPVSESDGWYSVNVIYDLDENYLEATLVGGGKSIKITDGLANVNPKCMIHALTSADGTNSNTSFDFDDIVINNFDGSEIFTKENFETRDDEWLSSYAWNQPNINKPYASWRTNNIISESGGSDLRLSQEVLVDEATEYTIKFKAKSENAGNVNLVAVTEDGIQQNIAANIMGGSYDWQEFVYSYTPDNYSGKATIALIFADTIDNLLIDEFKMYKDSEENNLILNGTLEDYSSNSDEITDIAQTGKNEESVTVTVSAMISDSSYINIYEKKFDTYEYRGSIGKNTAVFSIYGLDMDKEYAYKFVPVNSQNIEGVGKEVIVKTDILKYALTPPVLYKGSKPAANIEGGNTYSITSTVHNYTVDEGIPYEQCVVVYKDGEIIGFYRTPENIPVRSKYEKATDVTTVINVPEGTGYSMKVFSYDSMANLDIMQPMAIFN